MSAPKFKNRDTLSEEAKAKLFLDHLLKIQRDWDLNQKDMAQLLQVDASTISKWKKSGFPIDDKSTRELFSNIVAIHRSLSAMFSDMHNHRAWLRSPYDCFNKKTPLSFMTTIRGLLNCRSHLDYIRGLGA